MTLIEHASLMSPDADTIRGVSVLYARVLDLSEVDARDDFFVLGGTSLSAVELLALVQEEFSVQVPASDFYRATAVSELASLIRTLQQDETEGA